MVKIVISLKNLYAIVGVFILILLIGIGVYAYQGIVPATTGHTMGELMPSCTGILTGTSGVANSWSCASSSIPVCTGSKQGITWANSAWECKSLS